MKKKTITIDAVARQLASHKLLTATGEILPSAGGIQAALAHEAFVLRLPKIKQQQARDMLYVIAQSYTIAANLKLVRELGASYPGKLNAPAATTPTGCRAKLVTAIQEYCAANKSKG